MKETLVELQAKRIVDLEGDNKELCERIAELEATNKELENKLDELEYSNDELKDTITSRDNYIKSRLEAYIDLSNFWYKQSLIEAKEEIRKYDDLCGLRYEYMAEAIYNISHTEQSPERFFKLLKRYNQDL